MNLRSALGSQWIATIYVAAISMLLVIMLARGLGPEQFGVYSYVLSLASIYAILQDGGFRTLLFREGTSRSQFFVDKADQLLPVALGHVVIATIIGCGIVKIFPLPYKMALFACVLCFGFLAISNFISAHWKGQGNFEKSAAWQAITRTLTAGFIITAFVLGLRDVAGIFVCWTVGLCIAICLPLGRAIWKRPLFSFKNNFYHSCGAFITIDFATMIYFRCDIVLLKYLGSSEDAVGQYAAAYRLLEGVIMLTTPIAHICFRYLRLSWQRQRDFNRLFFLMFGGMATLSLAICSVGLICGKYFVLKIYGASFNEAGNLTILLLVALLFILPNYIVTQAIIALNKEKIYAIIAVFAACLNVGGNFVLIPIYGTHGAAFATIATEVSLLLALFFVYWHKIRFRFINDR